jgi:hypothetical protein
MLYANDPYWHDSAKVSFNPRQLAWVPSDVIGEISPGLSHQQATSSETVKVTYRSPQEVVLDVELDSPGLVVLADVMYPGWTLKIDDRPAPIYRVNGLMRGALVAANRARLVYTYEPRSFHVGLAVSAAGLVALLPFLLYCIYRPIDPVMAASSILDSSTDLTERLSARPI